jgi:hypothetical protein
VHAVHKVQRILRTLRTPRTLRTLRTWCTRSHTRAAITRKVEAEHRLLLFDQLDDWVQPLLWRLGHDQPGDEGCAEQRE